MSEKNRDIDAAPTTVTRGGVTYYHYDNPPQQNPPPYTPHADPSGPPSSVPPPPRPQPAVMTSNMVPAVIFGPQVGSKPQSFYCSNCNENVFTKISIKPSIRTHLMAALLCVIGCWPCVCVPYCVDSCNNVDHSCPNCGVFLGTYRN